MPRIGRVSPLDTPVLSAAYFQADTIKGYRFWDQTGVVANHYVDRFQTIEYIAPGTLVCARPRDPGDDLGEVRVNPHAIWLSFRERSALDHIAREASGQVDWIARACDVTDFSRLGLRVLLLWPANGSEEVVDLLASTFMQVQRQGWQEFGDIVGGEFALFLTSDRLAIRVSFSPIQNVTTSWSARAPGSNVQAPSESVIPPERRLPDFALQMDVDLADNNPADPLDPRHHLERSIRMLETKLIPHVATILTGGA